MNNQETTILSSIDEILRNLKDDKNFYSHGGFSEQDYMMEQQRD